MPYQFDIGQNASHGSGKVLLSMMNSAFIMDVASWANDEQAAVLIDPQGRIVAANDNGKNLFGQLGEPLPFPLPETIDSILHCDTESGDFPSNGLIGEYSGALSFLASPITLKTLSIDGKPHCLLVTDDSHRQDAAYPDYGELRRIALQIQKDAVAEKRHIAHRMYDELAQLLGALKIDMDTLACDRRSKSRQLLSRLESMQALLHEAIASTRRIASMLHPTLLEDLGLIPALEWVAARFSRRSGIPCEIIDRDFPLHAEDPAGSVVFRLIEGILNRPEEEFQLSSVRISLGKQGSCAEVRIEERQRPSEKLPKKISQQSNYLAHVKEQLYLLGGTIGVRNLEPAGTLVHALVPIV